MGTHLYAASSFVFDGALTRHQKQEKARLFLDNVCDVNQRIQCFDEQCESFSIRPLTLAILLADSKSVIDLLKGGAEVDYVERGFVSGTPFNVIDNEMAKYNEVYREMDKYPKDFLYPRLSRPERRSEFLHCMKELEIIQHHLHDEYQCQQKGSVLLPRASVVSIPKK
jgi:hypothetical protein